MNYFLKYRFAVWAIIILSVIIFSSLGTLLFLKFSHKSDRPFKDDEARRHAQISQFFHNELKLTPGQEKVFKDSRHQFFQNSRAIFDSLEKKRIRMVEELGKPAPDSMLLYRISDEMGDLHARLRRETVRHLLNLHSICTPEQIKKLNTINNDLIGPEGPMHRMGKHKQGDRRPDEKGKPN